MMTGRYPQRSGITDYINNSRSNQPEGWKRNTKLLPAPYEDHLALSERTIAEELHDAGYATFFAGKWHMGGEGFLPTNQGFDMNKGGRSWGSPKSYFSPYGNPNLPDGPPDESLTLRLGQEACKFIEASRQQPFFAYVSFYSVHTPLQGPEKLVEKYEAKAASSNANGKKWGKEHANKVRLVQDHPTYAAMIEETDNAVGLVLDKLKALGLAENTIVLFTSDNGGLSTAEAFSTSNMPLRAGKGWMYEGGVRVASILRWPAVVKAGSTNATPIMSMDYFPTFLEVADAKPEAGVTVDGVSLVPLLKGGKLEERALYWDYPHYGNQGGSPGSAVREGKWKLIEWRENDSVELYDLIADPGETQNLAGREAKTAERLRSMLHKWRQEVGAKSPAMNSHYDPSQPQAVGKTKPPKAANNGTRTAGPGKARDHGS
jgi:arylsulfatase A-like enzyme